MVKILMQFVGSAMGRWVLGGLVIASIGTFAIMWHNHKEGLKEEGMQECVQEINKATLEALEDALAAEKFATAQLRASLAAAVAANEEAIARRNEMSSQLDSLRGMMETQRNEDPTYREWADAPLPDSVADRLRQAAGSATGHSN